LGRVPRRVQEEVLQQEKQQQVALLQELEEQKARLEAMLLDARWQREGVLSAATQEVPLCEQEVPLHQQEVPLHQQEVPASHGQPVNPGVLSQVKPPSQVHLSGHSHL